MRDGGPVVRTAKQSTLRRVATTGGSGISRRSEKNNDPVHDYGVDVKTGFTL
jgi:hypothetical protein